MFSKTNLLLILSISGLLISCATTYKIGRNYPVEHVGKISIGQTNENDIRLLFGEPWRTGISNGNIVYTYCYEELVFHHDDTIDRIENTLVVEFDETKVVRNYYFNVPGKGSNFLSILIYDKIKEEQEQEQVAWQNQVVLQ